MKKLLFICLFINSLVFAQDFNLISRQNIKTKDINNINVDLSFENVFINKISGEEISIEVYSNNLNCVPNIQTAKQTVTIQTLQQQSSSQDYCSIHIYIPVDFNPDSFLIKTKMGSISIKDLFTENDLEIQSVSGYITISNTNCSSLIASSISGAINLYNINCDYFYLNSTSSDLLIKLATPISAKSKIQTTSGNISFYSYENNTYNFDIFQAIPNSKNKLVKNSNPDGITIELKTSTGFIQILNNK